MNTNIRLTAIPLIAILFLSSACTSASSKAAKDRAAKNAAKTAAGDAFDAGLPGEAEVTEASLRGKHFQAFPSLAAAHFDYDQAVLSEEARIALKANAAWLKANGKVEVQIQGHSDERGTVAYNLALGQKRARAVRDYYRALGVSMRRMSTISYGKEKPDCQESSASCWHRNRRSETRARVNG